MSNKTRIQVVTGTLALFAAAALQLPATVAAQTAGDTSAGSGNSLVEVVVTARRRTENLQDVPITVTALTAGAIETHDVTNVADLNSFVPNMKISQDRATSSTINIYIRGVGQSDPLWGFEPGVGVYIDDVYMA
ncbi:MAG TPA: TonB-dependent receptor plug domain-containing protein, partial [Steroidobacteraceae bacterium]|nr:TonB-dependent receptor plug domain-containing protein [Steroidobacteraceae bacterium]